MADVIAFHVSADQWFLVGYCLLWQIRSTVVYAMDCKSLLMVLLCACHWYTMPCLSLHNWLFNRVKCNLELINALPPTSVAVILKLFISNSTHYEQERQGRWCIFDTGWSHWINYLVKEDTMKVAWPGSNEIILVSGMKIVAKSQSDLWRLIMNSSAKFKADSISGVYAKIYHRIGTSNTNSAKDVH